MEEGDNGEKDKLCSLFFIVSFFGRRIVWLARSNPLCASVCCTCWLAEARTRQGLGLFVRLWVSRWLLAYVPRMVVIVVQRKKYAFFPRSAFFLRSGGWCRTAWMPYAEGCFGVFVLSGQTRMRQWAPPSIPDALNFAYACYGELLSEAYGSVSRAYASGERGTTVARLRPQALRALL